MDEKLVLSELKSIKRKLELADVTLENLGKKPEIPYRNVKDSLWVVINMIKDIENGGIFRNEEE